MTHQLKEVGLSISDLHLGQIGSVGHKHLEEICEHISKHKPAEIFLNGDTIEVNDLVGTKDEIIEKVNHSLDLVEGMIKTAVQANSNVKIRYIFGNHDNFIELRDKLYNIQRKYPDNFTSYESHVKTGNVIHLHGDLQVNIPYKNDAEQIKAAFLGNIKTQMGAMVRGAGENKSGFSSVDDSMWKNIKDKQGIGANLGKGKTVIKNILDTSVSSALFPLNKIVETIYDTIKAKEPELLNGTSSILLGHYHPSGSPIIEHEGVKFIFTGPSTLLSKGPAYTFDINDNQEYDNFQPLEMKRYFASYCKRESAQISR